MFLSKEIAFSVAAIVVFALYLILCNVYRKKRDKKAKEKIINLSKENINISLASKKEPYDVLIVNQAANKKIQLKLVYIPENSCVTINYKDTFVLRYGGQKGHIGRNYPKARYMDEIVTFINMNNQEEFLKIILFYPSTEQILKYLNESDIGIVTYKDLPYGMKVMNFNDFVNNFEEIVQ